MLSEACSREPDIANNYTQGHIHLDASPVKYKQPRKRNIKPCQNSQGKIFCSQERLRICLHSEFGTWPSIIKLTSGDALCSKASILIVLLDWISVIDLQVPPTCLLLEFARSEKISLDRKVEERDGAWTVLREVTWGATLPLQIGALLRQDRRNKRLNLNPPNFSFQGPTFPMSAAEQSPCDTVHNNR